MNGPEHGHQRGYNRPSREDSCHEKVLYNA